MALSQLLLNLDFTDIFARRMLIRGRGSRVCGEKHHVDDYARLAIPLSLLGCLFALPAAADTFSFSTGEPDGKIATATRPDIGKFEIESADDFVLGTTTHIDTASFTGLITGAPLSSIGEVGSRFTAYFLRTQTSGGQAGRQRTRPRSADAQQFAVRCRLCRARHREQQSHLHDHRPRLVHRPQLSAAWRHSSQAEPDDRRRWLDHRRGSAVQRDLHDTVRSPCRSLLLRASGPSDGCRRQFLLAVRGETDRRNGAFCRGSAELDP